MKRTTGFIYVLFICLNAPGQLSHVQSENVYITSAAYSTHFPDAFSFLSNPACLGDVHRFRCGVSGERKWMLKELDNTELAVCFPLANGGMGMALQHSGDADYNEQGLRLAYGVKAGRLQIGAAFAYLRDQASGYPANGFGSASLGICFRVSQKLIMGWELGLPVFTITGKTNPERASQFFNMGFGYEWAPDLFISFRVEKEAGLPVNITGYLEYHYGDQFLFAFGINGSTAPLYFKSGWKKNRLGIQFYTQYDPLLGFTPGIAIIWEGKNGVDEKK
jgi:hypothetical protein